MKAPRIDQLIQGIPSSLGSYAPVLHQIEEVLRSPQCSLSTVGEAIEMDPDLTVRLLRLANSAFYGFSSRLSTVSEAVSLIGIQQVQDLILASCVIERFADVPEEFVSLESFWQHSLACGIGARLIAMEKHLPKPEKFFVVGLLHDVGRLVYFAQAPAVAREVFEVLHTDRMLLREAEMRVMGYDHQEIAGALLCKWNFPENLVRAVVRHHTPAAGGEVQMAAAAVHLADHLVNAMRIGSSGERFIPPLDERAWKILGLDPDWIGPLVAAIDAQTAATRELFTNRKGPQS
jgi:HD-like signal output (HDOD) protein